MIAELVKLKDIKPLHLRVVVKADSPEEVSKGGIIIPNESQEKQVWGKVIAVGPDVEDEIYPGLRVLYGKFSGQSVDTDEGEVVIMLEPEIFAYMIEDKVKTRKKLK